MLLTLIIIAICSSLSSSDFLLQYVDSGPTVISTKGKVDSLTW